MRFNTFDEVAKWYDATKPIISKNHTKADDVRPLRERRYKWERIVKIDDNTYALADGSWGEMSFNGSHPNEKEVSKQTAAILWERRPDGEYVSIRGCMGTGYSISRYQFYNNYLPQNLRHTENTRQGQHWITNFSTGERHTLPKMGYKYDWTNRKTVHYEDKSLVFKREGNNFVRVGEVQVKTKHIDKDKKAEVKPMMRKFYEWVSVVAPLVPTDYSSRHDFAEILTEAGVSDNRYGAVNLRGLDAEKVKQVMTDEEHPCRLALAAVLLANIEYTNKAPEVHAGAHVRVMQADGSYRYEFVGGKAYTQEETDAWFVKESKRLRSAYNRTMNKLLDVFATETV